MHPYPPDHPIWTIGTLTLVGVAMVGSLFSADAWNNITSVSYTHLDVYKRQVLYSAVIAAT